MRATEKSWYANIWLAGDYATAIDGCRAFANERHTCVTVSKADFVYTGGMESGVCVRMVQYPKFPTPVDELERQAFRLAIALRSKMHQDSVMVELPEGIIWDSNREVERDD